MRQGSWRSTARRLSGDYLIEGLVGAIVVGSALALGGMHVQSGLIIAAVSGVAGALALRHRSLSSIPAPVVLMLALAAYSVLQTIPLPVALLAHLSPRAAEVWALTTASLGQPASFAPISYDPGATAIEAAHWFSYACVFLAATAIGRRRGTRWGALLLLGSGLLIALLTFAHGLTQASSVYGFYRPSFGPSRWHIGPLLNPNTLAGYLNLAAFCGLGLALSRRPPLPRWLLASGVAVLLAISVLSGSRGGLLALVGGLVLLIVFHRIGRRNETGTARLGLTDWLVLGGPVAGGLVFAALGSTGMTWRELLQSNVDKLQLAGWTQPLIMDHLWLGIGRGAFESVFQQYRAASDNVIYSHPENVVVQWVAEWGLVAGGVGLIALAFSLRSRNLNMRAQSTAAGIGVGAVMLALQNLADLSLEVPAIPLALAAALGCCWGSGPRSPRASSRTASAWLPAACIAATLLVTAHGVARGLHPVAHNRLEVHRELESMPQNDARAVQALRESLTLAMLRHPAEPYFPRVRAIVALQRGGEPALKWIDLALSLAPWSGRTHLILATALARNRAPTHQVLLELRLAAEYDPGLAVETGRAAAAVTQSPSGLERAAPSGPTGARVLLAAAEQLQKPEQATARLEVLKLATRRDPAYLPPRLALVEDLLSGERCAATPDCEAILDAQLAGIETHSRSSLGLELRARRLSRHGKTRDAEASLAQGCGAFKERLRCLTLRLALAEATADPDRVVAAGKDLADHACSTDRCLQGLMASGRALERADQMLPALGYFERAAHEQPSAETLNAVARTARELGLFSRAEAALTRAARMKGADPNARKALDERKRARWLLELSSSAPGVNSPPAARN